MLLRCLALPDDAFFPPLVGERPFFVFTRSLLVATTGADLARSLLMPFDAFFDAFFVGLVLVGLFIPGFFLGLLGESFLRRPRPPPSNLTRSRRPR